MRRRAAATLVALVVAAGLGACGDGEGSGSATDAGGRPLLPAALGSGGGAERSAMAAEAAADSAAGSSTLAGAPPVEYRLADGAEAPAREAGAYRFVPEDDDAEADLEKAFGGGPGTTIDVRHGAWFFQREIKTAGLTSECRVLADGSCAEQEMPPPPPGVPSAEQAEEKLRGILDVIGVDASEGRFVAQDPGGPAYTRGVTFEPTVDGIPVQDLATTVAFGENGRVDYANGFLGRFEKVGDYPLVALDEALDRFQAGFVGGDARVSTGVAVPEPALDTPVASDGGGTSGSTGSASSGSAGSGSAGSAGADATGQTEPGAPGQIEPAPGTVDVPRPVEPPAPVEPQIIEITGAELALTAVYPRCEGGDLYLIPSFRLLPTEAGFTVPAVEEASVEAPADSEETTEPCPGQPEPDEPVGRPEPAPMPPDAGGREPANP